MMMGSPELTDMDDYQFPLPGFRFHPTDEELVGFYLRRKVEKKAVGIELIKQIDIYKYNPWDLPHASGAVGENEGYFFCKRGRKYKNSVRPNRVTGSGFWKATGIDKPIYGQSNHHCVGLKKTLVYYRGSAGRGTKTEWMMNEFRLPSSSNTDPFAKIKTNLEEAEIWTLCRIFKRNVSSRKITPNWREIPAITKGRSVENMNFKTTSNSKMEEYGYDNNEESRYISFSSSFMSFDDDDEKKKRMAEGKQWNQLLVRNLSGSSTDQTTAEPEANYSSVNVSPANSSSFSDFDEDATDLFGYEKWEELKSIMESDLYSYDSSSFMC